MFLRKKIERGIVLGFAAAALLMASGFAEQQTSVVVGEAPLVFEKGAEPVVQNDRNLLPLRKIGEALDAAVYWLPEIPRIAVLFKLSQRNGCWRSIWIQTL